MKKVFLGLLLAAALPLLFTACKKDDAQPTTTQRVQKLWVFDKSITHGAELGFPEFRDTTTGIPGEYFDFRADNKVYSFSEGEYDTVNYQIVTDTSMVIDGNAFIIKVLTDNQFQVNSYEYTAPNDFFDVNFYFKR